MQTKVFNERINLLKIKRTLGAGSSRVLKDMHHSDANHKSKL